MCKKKQAGLKPARFCKKYIGDLFDISADNGGYLHHINGLSFF